MKVLFIGAGEPNASSRYRAEEFVRYANLRGDYSWSFFAIQPNKRLQTARVVYLALMIVRKCWSIVLCSRYDIIYLQRNPVKFLSPTYEWFIARILGKKIIFDFDDNLWIITGNYDNRIDSVLRIADMTVVGNNFLAQKAQAFSKRVEIVPTVVNTDVFKAANVHRSSNSINICWSGSRPGNPYLIEIEPALMQISAEFSDRVKFTFVSDIRPPFKNFSNYTFVRWSAAGEKDVLESTDIGLMPLPSDDFSRAKCGFKLILYGAYGIALVASPVGVNESIVEAGTNGYLAKSIDEWVAALRMLILDKEKLTAFKQASRQMIEDKYSIQEYQPILKKLIESI